MACVLAGFFIAFLTRLTMLHSYKFCKLHSLSHVTNIKICRLLAMTLETIICLSQANNKWPSV